MAGFLVLPLLESFGLSTGISAAAEVAVSTAAAETIGTTVSGAVAGAIGSEIDKKVLESLPTEVREAPKRIFNDYRAAAKSLISKDPRYILENRRNASGYFTRQSQPLQQPQQSGISGGNDIISTNQPIIKTFENLYNQLSTETEIVFEPTGPEYNPYYPTVSAEVDTTENDIQESDYFEKKVYEEAYEKYQYSPRDLARWLIDYSRDLSITRNPIETLKNIVEMNPSFIGLTKKITTFLSDKTLPNTAEFKTLSETYNFSNITYNNFSIGRNPQTGLIEVTFVDEVGDREVLPQNTGLILPSVPGTVFMGPYSINDKLPNPTRVEDWCSMSHDYSYFIDGYFSKTGDMKFISRLSNCLKTGRVLPENRALVESTIIYFSTISLSLGLFFNKSSPDLSTNNYTNTEFSKEAIDEDVFDLLGSPKALDMPEVSDDQYLVLRNEFYKIMKSEMKEYNKTDGYFNTAKNDYVENALLNLEITLG